MQRIFNYGSTLQAYGLRRLIEALGNDVHVTFVDYEPGPVLVPDEAVATGSPFRRTIRKFAHYSSVDAKVSDKLRFLNHKRRYGRRYLPQVGIPRDLNRDLNLDVEVIGSDEVFNCVQANSKVGYTRDLFGHATSASKLISYAASFGNTTMDKIERLGIKGELEQDLGSFDAISVRDQNSADIVYKLTGTKPLIHVDPVLAYDYMEQEQRIPPIRLYDDRYVVVYGYPGRLSREENQHLRSYAQSIDAKILCFGGVQACCDRFIDCDPFALLAYFRDAEAVITDTFHGTIFAAINRKAFGTIVRAARQGHYGNEEKLGYLLDALNLGHQRITDMARIQEVLATRIDYDAVAEKLVRERVRTRQYLKTWIEKN